MFLIFPGSEEAVTACVSEELNFSVGENVRGYVVKVDSDWLWLSVSRSVMAHLYVLDSSCEPHELQKFQQCYSVGQAVKGRILSINREKKLLRLASCSSFDETGDKASQKIGASTVNDGQQFSSGDIVGGRIKKILPSVGGLLVQIGPHLFGRVHYTELVDEWVPHPISKYQEGQFVKCKILEICRSSEGILHVDLSLRDSVITNEL